MRPKLFTPRGLLRAMTPADLVVSVAFLLAAFAAPRVLGRADGERSRAIVTVDRREVVALDLSADSEEIVRGRIGEVRIQVRDGAVRIAASGCPHQICVAAGAKRRPGEVIACVPNALLVRIVGPADPAVPDAVTR